MPEKLGHPLGNSSRESGGKIVGVHYRRPGCQDRDPRL